MPYVVVASVIGGLALVAGIITLAVASRGHDRHVVAQLLSCGPSPPSVIGWRADRRRPGFQRRRAPCRRSLDWIGLLGLPAVMLVPHGRFGGGVRIGDPAC